MEWEGADKRYVVRIFRHPKISIRLFEVEINLRNRGSGYIMVADNTFYAMLVLLI